MSRRDRGPSLNGPGRGRGTDPLRPGNHLHIPRRRRGNIDGLIQGFWEQERNTGMFGSPLRKLRVDVWFYKFVINMVLAGQMSYWAMLTVSTQDAVVQMGRGGDDEGKTIRSV